MEEALIRVKDLCKIYNPGENEVRALDHINPVSYTHLTLPTKRIV